LEYKDQLSEAYYDPNIFYGRRYIHYNKLNPLHIWALELAKTLKNKGGLSSLEHFFIKLYSNDFENTFAPLNNEDLNGTKLHKLYKEEWDDFYNSAQFNASYSVGAWLPTGNLAKLGPHLQLSGEMGWRKKRFNYDFTGGFIFGKSANEYQVVFRDSLINTREFLGGWFGFNTEYNFYKSQKNSFQLLGGIAYKGFTAYSLSSNDSLFIEDFENSVDFSTPDFNFGLGYKRYTDTHKYWAIETKFHLLDYQNPVGTKLSGNAFSINLTFGFTGNLYESYRLRELN